jgi:hypothetical protein
MGHPGKNIGFLESEDVFVVEIGSLLENIIESDHNWATERPLG